MIEIISRSYSIVLLKPLLKLLRKVLGKKVDFNFFSDSTCFLRLLRDNLLTTNKLAANSKIQKENLELLSTQFDEGVKRAAWLPCKLNLSDMLTRAVVNCSDLFVVQA